jgi:hypothetical protein
MATPDTDAQTNLIKATKTGRPCASKNQATTDLFPKEAGKE